MMLKLIGLVGRWARVDGLVTEVSLRPNIDIDKSGFVAGELRHIVMHPGAGKTFKIIPDLVLEYFSTGQRGKVIVLGPTRVVCQELYRSLKRTWGSKVGLNIKDSRNTRNLFAPIQITTHKSFLNMVTKAAREVQNIGLLIVDEAHVDSTATRLCRKYAESLVYNGKSGVFLSATLDDKMDSGSNYRISDRKIKHGEEEKIAREAVDMGKRVLWFLPAYEGRGGVRETAKRLKQAGYQALELARATYTQNNAHLNDPEYPIVLTTNIAECGMNIEADVVINTAKEFDFFESDGMVDGRMQDISKASWIQRRGRVGRKKEGIHYYTNDPCDTPPVKASERDAELLLAGREWAKDLTINSPLQLSDKQFMIWLDREMSPRVIHLLYDYHGNKKKGKALELSVAEWMDGNSIQAACGCGKCPRKCQWFDMRHHDLLCTMLGKPTTGQALTEPIWF